MTALNSNILKKEVTDTKFYFVILFVLSAFLISTDNTLKFASISFSSIIAFVMLLVFILDSLVTCRFALRPHPLQKWLWLLFLWVTVSFLIAKIDIYKIIPEKVYSYVWTTGFNSPSWRGLSFLFRFFLSIFAIDFIISSINTKSKFSIVLNTFIICYSLICLFGLIQIVLFGLFNVEFGRIYIPPGLTGFFRIGGYVGEPQTFGLLLISGYFILIAAIKNNKAKIIRLSKPFLMLVLLIATIDLVFTFSVAALGATIVGFIFNVRVYVSKKSMIFVAVVILVLCIVFYDVLNVAVFKKFIHEVTTVHERSVTWIIGFLMFKHNILTGVGIGQAPFVMSEYIPSYIVENYQNFLFFDIFRQPPMNSYLEMGAETGIIGFVLLGLIIYKTYKLKFKRNDSFAEFVKFGCGASLFVLAVAANSSSGNFYAGIYTLLFAIYLAGVLLANNEST